MMNGREFLKVAGAVLASLFLPIPAVAIETPEHGGYVVPKHIAKGLFDAIEKGECVISYPPIIVSIQSNIDALRALGVHVNPDDYQLPGKVNDVCGH